MKARPYGTKLLSINSTILEITREHIDNNRSLKSIAQEMGVSAKSLTRVLKHIGFEYDSASKKWRFIWLSGDDYRNCTFYSIQAGTARPVPFEEEPFTMPIDEELTPKEDDSNMNITQPFTPVEIDALKRLAQEFLDSPTKTALHTDDISTAIKMIPTGDNGRRTFVIPNELLEQLDEFCKVNKVQRSHFLSVAIGDALAKYK